MIYIYPADGADENEVGAPSGNFIVKGTKHLETINDEVCHPHTNECMVHIYPAAGADEDMRLMRHHRDHHRGHPSARLAIDERGRAHLAPAGGPRLRVHERVDRAQRFREVPPGVRLAGRLLRGGASVQRTCMLGRSRIITIGPFLGLKL